MVGKLHNDLKITKIFLFATLVITVVPDLSSTRPNWLWSLDNYKAYNYGPEKSRWDLITLRLDKTDLSILNTCYASLFF